MYQTEELNQKRRNQAKT